MGATLSGGGLPLGQALTQPNHFSTDDRWDRTVRRRLGLWLLLLVAVLMSASCTARPPAAPTPMAASPSPSASAAATYASESFIVPLHLKVPSWLPARPNLDNKNFLTWDLPEVAAVRFLVPVSVYTPGSKKASKPAKDYLPYLLSQAKSGVRFTDKVQATIGGRPATILSGTTDRGLDGSLGCPHMDEAPEDCFGLQPDLSLRLAVVQFDDKVLLIWLRTRLDAEQQDTTAKVASFTDMLASISFRGSAGQSTSSSSPAAATPIDGVWSATWTYEELKKSPLLYGRFELNDKNWGTHTVTFKRGQGRESMSRFKGFGGFTYSVKGDIVTIEEDHDEFVMHWRISGNKLYFTRDDSLGAGPTGFVIKPFVRQR
ncbi:MAG TPA: hypothetical protein VKB85_12870 [Propionibacteriaceae bacterium]|nr:hypothetical protein [Propionibacteriaceae bacterium]